MKSLLLLLAFVQFAAWTYFAIYSPRAPRIPDTFNYLEEKIKENHDMKSIYSLVDKSKHFVIDQAIETNSSYVDMISNTGKRGWEKLDEASLLLLISGFISLIASLKYRKAEPAEIVNASSADRLSESHLNG